MNVGESVSDQHAAIPSQGTPAPGVKRYPHEVLNGRVDFIDAVLACNLTHRSAREMILAEFERRYILRLDLTYDSEASRAAASQVTPRYLRKLRRQARLHALGR